MAEKDSGGEERQGQAECENNRTGASNDYVRRSDKIWNDWWL